MENTSLLQYQNNCSIAFDFWINRLFCLSSVFIKFLKHSSWLNPVEYFSRLTWTHLLPASPLGGEVVFTVSLSPDAVACFSFPSYVGQTSVLSLLHLLAMTLRSDLTRSTENLTQHHFQNKLNHLLWTEINLPRLPWGFRI